MGSSADVFSMGCVLFELLTGLYAFARDEDMNLSNLQFHRKISQHQDLWVSLYIVIPLQAIHKVRVMAVLQDASQFICPPAHAQVSDGVLQHVCVPLCC